MEGEEQINVMEGDSLVSDNEPLVINSVETHGKVAAGKKSALITVNVIILGYFMPVYAFSVAMEQDVNKRIASSYNISDRNREACLAGNNTNETKIHDHIDAEASYWMILLNSSNILPAFVVGLLAGPISDKIGRKVTFLIPTFGAIIKYLGCLLISYFQWPIWAYAIALFVEGFTGASPLFYAGCVAYTADNTDTSQRFFGIVMVDLALSLSAVIANFCSGYIITGLGYTWSYIIMGALSCFTSVLVCAFIRGSPMDLTNVKIFTTEHFNKVKHLYTRDNGTNRRWKLNMLLLISCLFLLGNIRLSDVLTYTMLDRPFCFSSIMVGNFFSILHVVMTVGGFLLMWFRRCGVKEIPLLYVAYLSMIGFEILISFAQDEKAFFSATLFSVGLVLGQPLINSLMSPLVGPDEQGALFASVSWLVSSMLVVNNVYQNALYSASVSVWRGFVCIVTAGVVALDIILLTILAILWRREDNKLKLTVKAED